jgi:hypothetical protein
MYSTYHNAERITLQSILHNTHSINMKHPVHIIFIRRFTFPPHSVKVNENKKVIYWCVAYLPSEASIIEH